MAIYAIADLHLSGSVQKPMDIFGEHWTGHSEKIIDSWTRMIKETDLVLIPGDISWAMNMKEAEVDLDMIESLPGKKVLLRGNHDYWWKAITKLNAMYKTMYFLQNNVYLIGDTAICGTRGWLCPNDTKFTEHDKKLYERELKRLELSLEQAKRQNYNKIIVILHYPPTNDQLEESGFTTLIQNYNVNKVIYGHLHGKESFKVGLQGIRDGIEYILVSSDYLEFKPKLIM